MAPKNDGGAAFPGVSADGTDENVGMSLRDYFAAKAMQALLACDTDNGRFPEMVDRSAETAYRAADAMLKARG